MLTSTIGVVIGFGGAWLGCSLDYDAFEVTDEPLGGAGGTGGGGSGAGGAGASGPGGAGGSGGATSAVKCGDQYGDVTEYFACDVTATTCTFYFHMNDSVSCDEACGQRGGECIAMHNNASGTLCDLQDEEPCSATNHNHAICICSRGCGGGEPCGTGETCSSGACN